MVAITWESATELDATMVSPESSYVATSTPTGDRSVLLTGAVLAGITYEIRVNSYYAGQPFTIRADLIASVRQ